MTKYPVPLNLDVEDLALLRRLTEQLSSTRADVIRYAIRHYALTGPWTVADDASRRDGLGIIGPLQTGPRPRGVA